MEQSTTELIERLSRLERQQAGLQRSNKHLRMMTGALMLVCGALFTMAQTSSAVPDTLEAQQFLVRDSGGKLRAALGVISDGAVGLNFTGPNGNLRTSLDVPAAKTPGLAFYREDGKPAWGVP